MALLVCLLGWVAIGGVVAFTSIFTDERPPLSVDACVWAAGIVLMFLIYTNGG